MKRPRLSERDNYRHWTLYNSNNFYGMSPERYEEITAGLQEEIDDPLIYDPETDTKIPKTPEQAAHQQEMLDGWKKDKELINRMHQPMGTFMGSSWKDDDGDYLSSKSHKKGLEDSAGGSFNTFFIDEATSASDYYEAYMWHNKGSTIDLYESGSSSLTYWIGNKLT